MSVLLETDRLVLRKFVASDVDHLVELDADPEVMHFITNGQPTTRAEIETEVLPEFLRWHRSSTYLGFWAAEEQTNGSFLGWFHLRPGDGHSDTEPELGYRLRRSAWGRGLATEGCRALIDHAFGQHQIERILAETMVVHTASRRVMDKCGLRPARFFRADWPYAIPGDEHGDVEYVITRAAWLQQRSERGEVERIDQGIRGIHTTPERGVDPGADHDGGSVGLAHPGE